MPNIIPVSDLKNYSEVLSKCQTNEPVYLTKNGRGKYVVQSIEAYEKQVATLKLLAMLSKGEAAIRKDGGLTLEEAFEDWDI